MISFILIAVFLVEVEKTLLQNSQRNIAFRYSNIVAGYDNVKVWAAGKSFYLSEYDKKMMNLYELLLWLLPPITYIICSCAAGFIFFYSKVKKPLKLLSSAAQRITNNDLNFIVDYDKNDEMGKLCLAFEQMRYALEKNTYEMWRQIADRKRLNAAFSHDMRTPLTVLEGHLSILYKFTTHHNFSLDETLETYSVMLKQISRLKDYVSSMNTLQQLEDIPIKKRHIKSSNFLETLNDTATIVCAEKQLKFYNLCNNSVLNIDPEIVIQVFENLISNAVRYASAVVSITYEIAINNLIIRVADDGPGFDAKGLKVATDPFYSTDKDNDHQHFGLGLNICKILCDRHGGSIKIENDMDGGAKVTASFYMM